MDSDTRTAEEIQRDIERERSALSDTLNTLNDTLSYESIGASLTEQVRSMGSDVIDDLAGTIIERTRQKPIAAGLVLAGLAWITLGSSNGRAASSQSRASKQNVASRGTQPHRSYASDVHRPSPGFESTRVAANDRVERLAQDAKSLRDRVSEGTEALSEEARARVIQAREAAVVAAENAVDAMRAGARKTKNTVHDNPLAVGGVALAIGAAVGGVLLLRKQEQAARDARNELFREADRVMNEELERSGSPAPPKSVI